MDSAIGERPEAPLGQHLPKRARRNKGVVAVFNEDARKEFITGFRKRKQARRKVAEIQQVEKDRQKRLENRKETRIQRKIALGELDAEGKPLKSDNDEVEGSGSEGEEPRQSTTVCGKRGRGRDFFGGHEPDNVEIRLRKSDDDTEGEEAVVHLKDQGGPLGLVVYKGEDTTVVVRTTSIPAIEEGERHPDESEREMKLQGEAKKRLVSREADKKANLRKKLKQKKVSQAKSRAPKGKLKSSKGKDKKRKGKGRTGRGTR